MQPVQPIKLQSPLFLVAVLTNKLVILTNFMFTCTQTPISKYFTLCTNYIKIHKRSIIIPNISFWMHKEGSKTYNDLIKILILLLCISIRQEKEIEMSIIGL